MDQLIPLRTDDGEAGRSTRKRGRERSTSLAAGVNNSVGKPKRQRPRVPDEERRRVSRACKTCRDRKSRCIPTEVGGCWRCVRNKLACGLGSDTGDKDGKVVDQEQRQEQGQGSEEEEDEADDPGWIEHTAPISPIQKTKSSPLSSQRDTPPEPVIAAPNSVPDHSGGIPDLVVEDFSPGCHNEEISRGSFLTKVREAMFLDIGSRETMSADFGLGSGNGAGGGSGHGAASEHSQATQASLFLSDPRDIREAIASFPPKEIAEFLVSTFFDYAVDSFFYFHQPWFMHEFHQFYDTEAVPRRGRGLDVRFISIALLVFAVGSQFAQFKSSPSTSTLPTTFIQSQQTSPGLNFYKHARRLFPDIVARYSLEAVQVSLLAAIFELPSSARDLAYFSLGMALRIAVANGFHRDMGGVEGRDGNGNEDGRKREQREIRCRLWWSVWSLERSISIKMGRPDSIREEDITAPLPTPLPALDSCQKNNNIHHQIAYANLTLILNRVVQQVSSTFIRQSPQAIQSLEILKKELKSWRANLPPELQLHNLNPKAYGFRTVVHLHQNYHHAWIMMCRIPLLMLVRERLRESFNPSTTIPSARPLHLDKTLISQMATTCSKAARKMIRLFEILRDNDYLARFSFTDFHGCSIATIIILLHGILERDVAYDATLTFAVESLWWMASESETARLGAKFVEGFKQLADEAVARMDGEKAKEASSQWADEGYERWLRWIGESEREILQHQGLYHPPTRDDPELLQEQHQQLHPPSTHPHYSPVPAPNSLINTTTASHPDSQLPAPLSSNAPQIPPFHSDVPALQDSQNHLQFQPYDPFSADLDPPLYGFSDDSFILGFTGLDVLNYREF
ncbi:hypothetical protein BP5796_09194 [Coleophoma crateriformis]|uniref:Zn(2)-C6 fungal-type domain-containing protein n=1 Tax=Coleophoma crateriformis TaxID=565419 RepID=A0A3D8R3D3_9HELO|nr:hypothetical protein BP5796_09194 [Coleophoma crateriformis]